MNFEKYVSSSNDEKLAIFMSSLSSTNRTAEYYVNWEKVTQNTKVFEKELYALNYLLGKDNIEEIARELFKENPNLLKAIPTLIASREITFDVLYLENDNSLSYSFLDFENPKIQYLEQYMNFIKESGLLFFMKNRLTSNLVDFVYGIETGLDSNARKNRSGSMMEFLVNHYINKEIELNDNLETISQASAERIKEIWGIDVPIDKSSRRYDEAVFNKNTGKLYLIETNYYGGGGSKLKAVAAEFSEIRELLYRNPNIIFVWITDGKGWNTAHIPLSEAFNKIEYIFNLKMLENGFLSKLFKQEMII